MPQYGDLLLKALTHDVLSELLGADSAEIQKVITNIFPLAISNAFYEQIVLHYKLDILYCSDDTSTGNGIGGGASGTHRRGDLLEAYMSAIEKDMSRQREGYREIRDWLFDVLALRLRIFEVHNDSEIYTRGTVKRSITIFPAVNIDSSRDVFVRETNSGKTLKFETIRSASQARTYWRQQQPSLVQSTTRQIPWTILPSQSAWSGTSNLNPFRSFVFKTMKQTITQTIKPGATNLRPFWTELSIRLSRLQKLLEDDSESLLLFYYRVSHSSSRYLILRHMFIFS
jgi:hypothetical protein